MTIGELDRRVLIETVSTKFLLDTYKVQVVR